MYQHKLAQKFGQGSPVFTILLYMANDRSSEIPLKQSPLCGVMTEEQSQLGVNTNTILFNSDPNLLHLLGAESAQKYLSASFVTPPISSPDISLSCSVTNLPHLSENGKRRSHNGFIPVRPKSQALGLKTDRGATFTSPSSLFSASNVP